MIAVKSVRGLHWVRSIRRQQCWSWTSWPLQWLTLHEETYLTPDHCCISLPNGSHVNIGMKGGMKKSMGGAREAIAGVTFQSRGHMSHGQILRLLGTATGNEGEIITIERMKSAVSHWRKILWKGTAMSGLEKLTKSR